MDKGRREICLRQPNDQRLTQHCKEDGDQTEQQPAERILTFRKDGIQQIYKECQYDHPYQHGADFGRGSAGKREQGQHTVADSHEGKGSQEAG